MAYPAVLSLLEPPPAGIRHNCGMLAYLKMAAGLMVCCLMLSVIVIFTVVFSRSEPGSPIDLATVNCCEAFFKLAASSAWSSKASHPAHLIANIQRRLMGLFVDA